MSFSEATRAKEPLPNCGQPVNNEVVCVVSFMDLAGNSAVYEGKMVALNGYLAIDRYRLTIFFDERSYEMEDSRLSLEITGDFAFLERMAESYSGQVEVVGVFASHGDAADLPRLGTIMMNRPPLRIGPRVRDSSSQRIAFPVQIDNDP
ncbi:MAG: hypothetical protein MEQ07_09720 [Aquimonas sp.]|nr:hypothetical protein [Aquimonas sp.]